MKFDFLIEGNSDRRGKILWLLFAVAIAIIAFIRPTERTVTNNYNEAAYNWWSKQDLYDSSGTGFLYFPQSVLLYSPFTWQRFPDKTTESTAQGDAPYSGSILALRTAEALYRIISILLLGWCVFRLSRLLPHKTGPPIFFAISLLMLPASISAASNGQFNVLLAAAMLSACYCVSTHRWNEAVFWLILGIIIKPLGVVPFLLLVPLHRQLWSRSIAGLLIFIALGFAHWDISYVLHQWKLFYVQLTVAGAPTVDAYDDLSALFRKLGLELGDKVWLILRANVAIAVLVLCWIAKKRFSHRGATIITVAFAASYLMLFNPRTETNTYIVVAPFIAFFSAMLYAIRGATVIGWSLALICVGLGSENYGDFYKVSRLWWKPLITLVFFGTTCFLVLNHKQFRSLWDKYFNNEDEQPAKLGIDE